jgi:hypothetical protein
MSLGLGNSFNIAVSGSFNKHQNSQGKTLTMLALILATKKDIPPGFSNSTLIGTVFASLNDRLHV